MTRFTIFLLKNHPMVDSASPFSLDTGAKREVARRVPDIIPHSARSKLAFASKLNSQHKGSPDNKTWTIAIDNPDWAGATFISTGSLGDGFENFLALMEQEPSTLLRIVTVNAKDVLASDGTDVDVSVGEYLVDAVLETRLHGWNPSYLFACTPLTANEHEAEMTLDAQECFELIAEQSSYRIEHDYEPDKKMSRIPDWSFFRG